MKTKITITLTILISVFLVACSTSTMPETKAEETNNQSVDTSNQEKQQTAEYKELEGRFQSLKDDYLKLDIQLKSQQEAYTSLESEHAQLMIDLDVSNKSIQELELQIKQLQSKAEESTNELERKNTQITLLQQQITDLKKIKTSATAKSYNDKINKLELKNKQLLDRFNLVKIDFNALKIEKQVLEQSLSRSSENQKILEQQLADLIELEASASNLEQQLAAGLTNVLWQIPNSVNLNSVFEIIVTAELTPEFNGRVFVAELLPDTSLQLVSAESVEAQVIDGALQWRWRIKGIDEKVNAKVDLFIHQNMQYLNDRIMRQVYREQKYIALNNDNIIDKYGFWALAILLGLSAGYLIGRINKLTNKKSDK